MAPVLDKAFATLSAIAFNVALFAWLLQQPSPLPVGDDGPEAAMSVVWIARRDDPVVLPVSVGRQVPARASRPLPSRTRTSTIPEAQVADPVPVTAAADAWSSPPLSPGQDGTETGFGRNDRGGGDAFRTGPDDPLDVTPPRVTFTMRDSSLMGRLNRMSQANVCGDLRAALRAASGRDAGVIVRTMQERGCRI